MAEQNDLLDEIADPQAAEPTEPTEVPEAPQDEAPEEGEKMVNLNALHEAREQNRELREQMARRDERMNMLQERLDQFAQQQAQPQQEEAEPAIEVPDFNEDPQGNINARFSRLEQLMEKSMSQTNETQQVAHQTQAQQQLMAALDQNEREFASDHPDFNQAVKYVDELRMQELVDLGATQAQARQAVTNERAQVSAAALQAGQNPAEFLYNRAKRYGFTGVAQEQAQQQEEEQVDLENAESLGGGGGPSVSDMLEADEDEFDAMFQELGYGKKMS